uniref:Helix-turn-helix domain-containing protein n=1 Tax=mine drainage metagenome TaxID=410659 RepID=E6Q8U1_9ZZZZ
MEKLIGAGELAEILGLSEGTVRNRAAFHPELLPPRVMLGGGEGKRSPLRYRPARVAEWIQAQEAKWVEVAPTVVPHATPAAKRDRGRPRK